MLPPSHAHAAAGEAGNEAATRFRAHGRLAVRLGVTLRGPLRGERANWERTATVVDLSIAGAGVETEEQLTVGERVSIAFQPPTMWDPLIVDATVAWAHPLRQTEDLDAFGRHRAVARAGLAFDYATPDATLAMFEMLGALGFE